ncbi:MAG: NADP-dependent oxidoreductase [Actinobacteria bacterium]|nr:NADP-dependent oxidoreductase [Actinomycetota bacterium]
MSKAIVYTDTGPPDVLRLADVDEPQVAQGQVRLAVRAAAVNPIDWKIRSGAFGGVSLPATPGTDVAGVVDQVGDGVADLAAGDEVFGFALGGSYAEYAVVEDFVVKPPDMPWEVAASLPIAAETSQRVLDLLDVGDGDTLLIHGAAGSVGGIATQLAVARGAAVIGTASQRNHDYLQTLGATPTVYGDGLVDRVRALAPDGIDAVLDTAGKGDLPASIELRGGTTDRIATIADPRADDHGVTFSGGGGKRSLAGLREVAARYEQGTLVVPIRATYALADAAAAQRDSEQGHGRGKIVLVP